MARTKRKKEVEEANIKNDAADQPRSKYNVGRSADAIKERTYDDIVFDSVMEMKYYRDVVLPLFESGEIVKYELQKVFEFQPRFRHEGAWIRAIEYAADFYLEFADKHVEVIDIKGCADAVALLKRKMFWYLFPDVQYKWIVYVKKFGGWVDWDYVQKERRAAKKKKAAEKKNQEELKDEQNKEVDV